MSFARDLERASSFERTSEPLLEDRLESLESAFVRRIAEGMPLPALSRQARSAEAVVEDVVANAFKDWFAPQRSALMKAWSASSERSLPASIEQAYEAFLEKIALRKGGRVSDKEDVWDVSQERLDQILEMGAEAFRCVMQQQDGWIAFYTLLHTGEATNRRWRQVYLRIANIARGFLGVREAAPHERRELGHAGLQSVRSVVIPHAQGAAAGVHYQLREGVSDYELGRDYRRLYEAEARRLTEEGEERRAFGEQVRDALRSFEQGTLLGAHLVDNVRRFAEFIIRLEQEFREAHHALERVTTADARKAAHEKIEQIERQRSGARDALAKARTLLRIYDEAKRLTIIQPEEWSRAVRLTDVAKRLEY